MSDDCTAAIGGCVMSDGTVRRYNVSAWDNEPDVIVVRASDYDALLTQARELAEALLHQISDKNCTPYINRLVDLSQAVLKEGK